MTLRSVGSPPPGTSLIGYGSGYGYGYGDGSGYGSGSGYGYGSGYGSGESIEYAAALLDAAVGEDRANALREAGCTLAWWRGDAEGRPANGGSGGARRVGDVEELPGPLAICQAGGLHATTQPWKWVGARLFAVALWPPVLQQDDKYASLKREILAELTPNPWA